MKSATAPQVHIGISLRDEQAMDGSLVMRSTVPQDAPTGELSLPDESLPHGLQGDLVTLVENRPCGLQGGRMMLVANRPCGQREHPHQRCESRPQRLQGDLLMLVANRPCGLQEPIRAVRLPLGAALRSEHVMLIESRLLWPGSATGRARDTRKDATPKHRSEPVPLGKPDHREVQVLYLRLPARCDKASASRGRVPLAPAHCVVRNST